MKEFNILFPVLLGTILLVTLILFIGLFIYINYRNKQKFDWERQQFQQAVLQTEIEIREQTLHAISQDLHDNLGQIASLIKINLNLISVHLNEEDRLKIEESRELLKRMIADIKSLSQSLNSDNILKTGLIGAIMNDVQRISKTGYLNIHFTHQGIHTSLRPEIEIFLYRMTQEIINNTIKHAQASDLYIELDRRDKEFIFTFRDNGKGFDAEKTRHENPSGGNGLNNLQERCAMIGARHTIASSPGKGTSISIYIPYTVIP